MEASRVATSSINCCWLTLTIDWTRISSLAIWMSRRAAADWAATTRLPAPPLNPFSPTKATFPGELMASRRFASLKGLKGDGPLETLKSARNGQAALGAAFPALA
jgi:hypothetical protein